MGQRFIERLGELTILTSTRNVESPDVEQWRTKIVKQALPKVEKEVARQMSADDFDEENYDYDDVFDDVASDYFYEHSERPSDYIELRDLLLDRPASITQDDQLLDYLNNDPKALYFLLKNYHWIGRAMWARDRVWRPGLDALVESGAALWGKEIPVSALIDGIKIADLRKALPDEVKIRRKSDALEHIDETVLNKLPDLDDWFYIKALPGSLEAGVDAVRWSYNHARLILETFVCSERCAAMLELPKEPGAEYQIEGDCCARSRKAAERDPSSRKPRSLPPFHVACSAAVSVW